MKKGSVMFLGLVGAMGLSLAVIGAFDKQDSKVEYKYYCEQVNLWEYDADAGIEPSKRFGHPNYKGAACDQENK